MAEVQETTAQAQEQNVQSRGRSRARKPGESDGSAGKVLKVLGCVVLVGALGAGGAYAAVAQKYNNVFLPGTSINGVDASEKSVEEVKNLINQGATEYSLSLEERGGNTEEIAGDAVGIQTVFDGSIEKLLAEQNKYTWLSRKKNPQSFTIDTVIDFDESALYREIGALSCMDRANQTSPENAYISDYINGEGYKVIPETEGTAIDETKLQEAAYNAMLNLQPVLVLDEAGVYKEAAVKQDDPGLNATVEKLNKACVMSITYKFGDETEVLNGDKIHEWVGFDEAGNVTVNEAMVAEYVKDLASRRDTYGGIKQFKTTSGSTIEVKGGTYGWRINQKDETAQLISLIQAGDDVEREPIYKQTAASRENSGIGNTYVEVNLGDQ
ncbi:MAG TPA: peptidoglycan-binding protein, partial [Lachnoclostridium sp.]|nr:peptidoglycan-binding protein [Lachnoclostridium sp.]